MFISVAQHTLDIFEKLYTNLPPLVPSAIRQQMGSALTELKAEQATIEDVEKSMIFFSKKIWPYNQAFDELYKEYESSMAEKLFLQKCTPMLRSRYEAYKNTHAHLYGDLHAGSALTFFSDEERVLVSALVVDVACEIRGYAYQAVMHKDKFKYEEKIHEYEMLLEKIEEELEQLLDMAECEKEHPDIAQEIRQQVRGFEHGLAYLGPSVDYAVVCNSREHFFGRKHHIKKIRPTHRS